MRALRLTTVILLAAVLLAVGPLVAWAEEVALALRSVETSAYPEITVSVSVPAGVLESGDPQFTVSENGVPVDVVDTTATKTAREPVSVVLLIDTSGSMRGKPLEDAKSAAVAFVSAMDESDRIALVGFAYKPTVEMGFSGDRDALVTVIQGLSAAGETAVHDALVRAARLVEGEQGQSAIVLLSDGGDTVSINSFDGAVQAVRAAGAPVYAVVLESAEWDPASLKVLAQESGGKYLSAADSGGLLAIYEGIAAELQNEYRVTYTSLGPNTSDLEVTITATSGDTVSTGSLVMDNPLYAGTLSEGPALEAPQPSQMLYALAIGLAFIATALAVGAFGMLFERRAVRLEKLEFYDQMATSADHDTPAPGSPAALQAKVVEAVAYVAGRRGFTKVLHRKLEQAGLPLRPAEYMYLHVVAVIAVGVLLMFVSGSLAVGIGASLLTVIVPLLVLESAIERRKRAFEEQLPDVLDLLAGSLRAGWSMLQAIGLVVEQMLPPVSAEFHRVQTAARLGLPVERALEEMADRIASEDLRWTITAISIQREVGGNLAEVLEIVARTMRDRAELRRHIRALTAEGRFSGIILIALPFVELGAILLVNRRYILSLFQTSTGWVLVGVAAALLTVGAVWLNRAMKVEV